MNTVQSNLHDEPLTVRIKSILEESYDLGRLVRIAEIFGGYCNRSYGVWLLKGDGLKKYLLRQYNPNLAESDIRFEHALLNHLKKKGFDLTAGVISGRTGMTFVNTSAPVQPTGEAEYWALFDFLEGEDKYQWTKTDLTPAEFASSSEKLAKLHFYGRDFVKPEGANRVQPPIMEFLPTFKTTFSAYAIQAGERRFDRLFKDNTDRIFSEIDECLTANDRFQGMPVLPIHCDYHPGNLKFENEKVVGIIDFDWSKIDYRLFDVALGLVYFASEWTGKAAGSLRPDKFELFLKSYNDTCRRLVHLEPLTFQEQKNLLPMLAAANLYVIHWDLADYYETQNTDNDEYYLFIDHNIRLMYWIEDQRDGIRIAIQQACS